MVGVCGPREDSAFWSQHVKKRVFMECPGLLPEAGKKFQFKDKYFSFITWYNYLRTCPSCLLKVCPVHCGASELSLKADGFLDLSVVGQELFLFDRFYIVFNLPPHVSETPLMAILGANDILPFFACLCPVFEFNFIVLKTVAPSTGRLDIKAIIYIPFMAIRGAFSGAIVTPHWGYWRWNNDWVTCYPCPY